MTATPVVGVDGIAYAVEETTFRQREDFAGSNAFAYDRIEIKVERMFPKKKAHTGTATSQGWTKGKYKITGSVTFEKRVSSSLGTPAEHALWFKLAMGSQAEPSGVQWTLLASGSPPSAQLGVKLGNGLYIQLNGLIVTNAQYKMTGGNVLTCTMQFEAAELSGLRGTPKTGVTSNSTTLVISSSADARALRSIDSYAAIRVQFATAGDNSGSGFFLHTLNYTTFSATISPAVTTAGGDEIQPFLPTAAAPAGSEIQNIESTLTYEGVDISFNEFTLDHKTGHTLLNEGGDSARASHAVRGDREIKGSCKFYLLDENQRLLGDGWDGFEGAFVARCGPDTSTERLKFTLENMRFDAHAVPIPDKDRAEFDATFEVSQGSSGADAELVIDAD